MPWLNADSKMYLHPKMREVGLEAMGLWLMGGMLALHRGHPGRISIAEARAIGRPHVVRRLVSAGLWEPSDAGWTFSGDGDLWRIVMGAASRAPIPRDLRARIYDRDGYACVACGSDEDLTLDHVYPWSLGGPDTEENLQTMCRPCNSRKGASIARGHAAVHNGHE